MMKMFRPIRALNRHKKLAAVAIFSLSIAMALGIVSLSIGNTFLLLPPSAVAPNRLVMMHARWPGEDIGQISYPDYKYLREKNHVFADIAAAPNSIEVKTSWEGSTEGKSEVKIVARPVTDNYFAVMGIQPYLGGFFSPGDDTSSEKVAVMTYQGWKRLGGDPK